MNIALLGATGRVGQAFIKEAQKHGHIEIFALVRSAGTALPISEKHIITGNARRREDIGRLISKADTVVSCLGTDGDDTLSAAMIHIINSMKQHHVQRLITIGTAGILQSRLMPDKYRFESSESKRKSTRAAKEHARVYEMLLAEDIDWTIICPTYLPGGEAAGVYRFEQDQLPEGGTKITVGDTAHFLYRELMNPQFVRKRVGLAY
ncbi:SDR family oxidoreductase [Bacillus siamensis]|uniref:NAD(P)-dependent oxidoreductase n=1 Tax=Bacillus siamensis TaxID=659243 RepID=UPI002E1C8257|nr:SDR family oxidoreductase [Bacillus siamensis]MED0776423.1 SDR family oxidoreductase [Bacillus siamensis]MED0778196.1 SDR family oxidoreductase [Bacillus siamensis]MED0835053.1 SDR family oxidoreductase [Bacillus siamensis]